MSVVSSPRRQKSWQIAEKIGSLLDEVALDTQRLGETLRRLARGRGLHSDEDAARFLDVSYRQYQRWLSGESQPRVSSLKLIAERYDLPLAELLGEPPQSQLDRIEAKLDQLLSGDAPPEEPDAVVAETVARLAETVGSPPRKARGAQRSSQAAVPRNSA